MIFWGSALASSPVSSAYSAQLRFHLNHSLLPHFCLYCIFLHYFSIDYFLHGIGFLWHSAFSTSLLLPLSFTGGHDSPRIFYQCYSYLLPPFQRRNDRHPFQQNSLQEILLKPCFFRLKTGARNHCLTNAQMRLSWLYYFMP